MAVAPPMFTDRRLPFARNIYYHGVDTRQSPSMALPDPAWPSTHSNPRPSSAYPDDVPTQLSSWILSPPPPSSSSSWSTDSTFPPSLYSQPSKNTDHYQPGYAGSDSASSYASEYPESSQRTDLAHAISPPSLSASPYTSPYSSSHATIHRASSKYSLGNAIYTLDQDVHMSSSPPPPPARTAPRPHRPARRSPAVKIEQEDPPHDPFVHETAPAQSSAHPHAQTESQVPLRATQASTEMRQMMGVFRLNPFATQGAFGGPAARASPAEEATALEEEGSVIEFQLELDGACAPRTPSPPPNGLLLRKLSPGVSPGASCYGGHGGSGVDRRGSPVGLQAQAQGGGGGMQGGGWGYELPSEIAAYPLLTASQSQAQAHSSLSMAHVAFGHALAEGGSSTGPSGEPVGECSDAVSLRGCGRGRRRASDFGRCKAAC